MRGNVGSLLITCIYSLSTHIVSQHLVNCDEWIDVCISASSYVSAPLVQEFRWCLRGWFRLRLRFNQRSRAGEFTGILTGMCRKKIALAQSISLKLRCVLGKWLILVSFTSRLSSQGLDYVIYNKEILNNTKTMAVCGNYARGGLRVCWIRLGVVSKDGQINVFGYLGV